MASVPIDAIEDPAEPPAPAGFATPSAPDGEASTASSPPQAPDAPEQPADSNPPDPVEDVVEFVETLTPPELDAVDQEVDGASEFAKKTLETLQRSNPGLYGQLFGVQAEATPQGLSYVADRLTDFAWKPGSDGTAAAGGAGECSCALMPTAAQQPNAGSTGEVETRPETTVEDPPPAEGPTAPAAWQASSTTGSGAKAPFQAILPVLLLFMGAVAILATKAPLGIRAAGRLLRTLAGLPLFSRIAKGKLLDHGRRMEVFDFIRANPGQRLARLKKAFSFSDGSLRHHLRVLRRAQMIRLERVDGAMLVFPCGTPRTATTNLNMPRGNILRLVAEFPGLSQEDVGRRLGLSKRVISYHVSSLRARGQLRVERRGRTNRIYWATESDVPALGQSSAAERFALPVAPTHEPAAVNAPGGLGTLSG